MRKKRTLHTVQTTNVQAYDMREACRKHGSVSKLGVDSNIIVSGLRLERSLYILSDAPGKVDTHRAVGVSILEGYSREKT